jgi:biopolymer transport protein ExbB
MWHFFIKGGWVMIPLALCSLAGLAIVIERLLFFGRFSNGEREYSVLKQLLAKGKIEEAKKITEGWNSAISRITALAVKQPETNKQLLETVIQIAGEEEVKHLERGLGILDTIVTASPLLGLLGTVIGIIKSFVALSGFGGAQSVQLSAGIAEALYNTAFGLAIAIPALFFVNIFYGLAEQKARQLTGQCRELIAILVQEQG